MDKIGFIGAGNMGYAMMAGLVKSGMKENIIFTDKNLDRQIFVVTTLDVNALNSNEKVAQEAKYIILAVKPQFMDEVICDIKNSITQEQIIISIAPISINSLEKSFGGNIRIVHAMPNTQVRIGESISVISLSDNQFSDEEKDTVVSIFKSFGEVEIMNDIEGCIAFKPYYNDGQGRTIWIK